MPKRKSSQTDGAGDDVPRRSTRQRTSTAAAREAAASEPSAKPKTVKQPATAKKNVVPKKAKSRKGNEQVEDGEDASDHRQPAPTAAPAEGTSKTNGAKAKQQTSAKTATVKADPKTGDSGRQYWLMKAEPESRIENGVDVRFSIDDLAAKSEPEPWDGMFWFGLVESLSHPQAVIQYRSEH